MPLSQDARPAAITTPFGGDVLAFESMTAQEELSHLFEFHLDLVSENENLDPNTILGQGVTVELRDVGGQSRYFHGHVNRFGRVEGMEQYYRYKARVVPWLWFLTRTANCRVFQKMAVPDILQKVFRDAGFDDFEVKLFGSYTPWEYCVQYRETDFNFVSRLMEEEGIYYFFRHEEGKHILVLCNAPKSHTPYPGYDSIKWRPYGQHLKDAENIREWNVEERHRAGAFAQTDYDFEKPKNNLLTKAQMPGEYARSEFEIFDYPGEYTKFGDGEDWARVRMEEIAARQKLVRGFGDARGLACGHTFELAEPENDADAGSYLIISTGIAINAGDFESGGNVEGPIFVCSLTAMEAATTFRPRRLTEKPLITGVQTAVVTGPGGEEIYTDQFGRIKVQFHWDREGKRDENSSCWVRVAQMWAGQNWGAMHIPRIGQEVVVAFLEGDPDQPLVIGSVYNGVNMPPYSLPGEKVISGIKSESTLGGGGYNEFVFDDTKGEEKIRLHAEKDRESTIEHDDTTKIGHDRTMTVGNDDTETVGSNQTISIGGDRSLTVARNQDVTVMLNQTTNVAVNRTETIGVSESLTVGAGRTVSVGAADSLSVGGALSVNAGGAVSISAGGVISISAGAVISIQSAAAINIASSAAVNITAPAVALNGRPVAPMPPGTPI